MRPASARPVVASGGASTYAAHAESPASPPSAVAARAARTGDSGSALLGAEAWEDPPPDAPLPPRMACGYHSPPAITSPPAVAPPPATAPPPAAAPPPFFDARAPSLESRLQAAEAEAERLADAAGDGAEEDAAEDAAALDGASASEGTRGRPGEAASVPRAGVPGPGVAIVPLPPGALLNRPTAAPGAAPLAPEGRPPPPVFSIAELLTPWPSHAKPCRPPPHTAAGGGGLGGGKGATTRGAGVYTQRPQVSAPPGGGHPQAVRRQILRRSQHPVRKAAAAAPAPPKRCLIQGTALSAASDGTSDGTSDGACTGAAAALRCSSEVPTRPATAGAAAVGGGTPHRQAPGCSAGAVHVLYAAMSASSCVSSVGAGGWARHPSQQTPSPGLYVGSPPSKRAAAGAVGSRVAPVQSSAFEEETWLPFAAPRAPSHRPAPAHRSMPNIRQRRPAWERPLSVTPQLAASLPLADGDVHYGPPRPLAAASEASPDRQEDGPARQSPGSRFIAPRRANVRDGGEAHAQAA